MRSVFLLSKRNTDGTDRSCDEQGRKIMSQLQHVLRRHNKVDRRSEQNSPEV